MKTTNRPVRKHIVKRGDDSAARIRAAVKARQRKEQDRKNDARDNFRKADEKIEKLKGQIVTTKRTNNTMRVGAVGATAAGTLAANLIFLQGTDPVDTTLKYGIALGACIAAALMNRHFNNTDITMTEMLKRVNAWSKQDFTPEEVKSFKELYDQVNDDFKKTPSLRKDVKSNFIYKTSQGVIVLLGLSAVLSASNKIDYNYLRSALIREETLEKGEATVLTTTEPVPKTNPNP